MEHKELDPFLLCRRRGASRIVTLGAPVSVVADLARGLHANRQRRGGLLVCTDVDAARLAAAERELQTLELEDYVSLRHGHPAHTLAGLDDPLDLLWLDCPAPGAETVLHVLRRCVNEQTWVVRRGEDDTVVAAVARSIELRLQ